MSGSVIERIRLVPFIILAVVLGSFAWVLGAAWGWHADGSANDLSGHNMPMTLVGLMMIIVGFWGFLMACAIFPNEGWSWSTSGFTSIYGTPLIGAVVMVLCGLVPGYVLSLIMKSMGVLRVPESAEIAGLDATKVPSKTYPEGMSGGSTAPAE
jgi:ammonia channel protein AmtB